MAAEASRLADVVNQLGDIEASIDGCDPAVVEQATLDQLSSLASQLRTLAGTTLAALPAG